ncbi:IBR domain-containing protein [Rhizoctonia solani AG-1 IA]|uniref:RBR-type E3 ubiquitin transferase n=1 Tax=Thanatephorus cucumeris (strain AG1-IA) TaxID=983506 RepID=L8WPX7_THACA|nr:IBR domain-containing protein [Rhizoctonia solani AG-1 IA]
MSSFDSAYSEAQATQRSRQTHGHRPCPLPIVLLDIDLEHTRHGHTGLFPHSSQQTDDRSGAHRHQNIDNPVGIFQLRLSAQTHLPTYADLLSQQAPVGTHQSNLQSKPVCLICLESPDHTDKWILPTSSCTHGLIVCRSCFRRYIEYKILEGSATLTCPDTECRRALEPKDVIKRIQASAPLVICKFCHARSCFTHHVPWHSGLTCKQYTAPGRQALENRASENFIEKHARRCPNPACGHPLIMAPFINEETTIINPVVHIMRELAEMANSGVTSGSHSGAGSWQDTCNKTYEAIAGSLGLGIAPTTSPRVTPTVPVSTVSIPDLVQALNPLVANPTPRQSSTLPPVPVLSQRTEESQRHSGPTEVINRSERLIRLPRRQALHSTKKAPVSNKTPYNATAMPPVRDRVRSSSRLITDKTIVSPIPDLCSPPPNDNRGDLPQISIVTGPPCSTLEVHTFRCRLVGSTEHASALDGIVRSENEAHRYEYPSPILLGSLIHHDLPDLLPSAATNAPHQSMNLTTAMQSAYSGFGGLSQTSVPALGFARVGSGSTVSRQQMAPSPFNGSSGSRSYGQDSYRQ